MTRQEAVEEILRKAWVVHQQDGKISYDEAVKAVAIVELTEVLRMTRETLLQIDGTIGSIG